MRKHVNKLLSFAWALATIALLISCASGNKITYADYVRVRPGMTYQEIENNIGMPGLVLNNGQFLDGALVAKPGEIIYYWRNENGSNMTVSFVGGRASSAAQWNLH